MDTHAFTVDVARALPGPGWLADRRNAAAEILAGAALPTPQEEVWRYSPIAELGLAGYEPAVAPGAPLAELEVTTGDPRGALAALGLGEVPDPAAYVEVVDGVVTSVVVDDGARRRGLFAGRLAEHPEAEKLLGARLREAPDVFVTMNDAFTPDPVGVIVPDGVQLDGPVVVAHRAGARGAAFPRVVVAAGEDAGLAVVEVQRGGGPEALGVPVTELRTARAARLAYLALQQLEPGTWQLGNQTGDVEADATFVGSVIGLGGSYVRTRTDCRLTGRGATGNLVSLYFGRHDQVLDFRIFQEHLAPDTNSNLLFKGAVDDRAKAIYTGLIHVGRDAKGTNAMQTNRNLKLSDHAWAESVPNLEIENNQVSCSHASTIGPIDEEQRFYLESRGVPPAAAERLVVAGFFAEVLAQLPVAGVAPAVAGALTAKQDEHDPDSGADRGEA